MATKSMWIISWNCEAMSVPEIMAADLWSQICPDGTEAPDLLAVGLQEAQIKRKEFLGHTLARLYGYNVVADETIHGMTKLGQAFSGFGKKNILDKAGCYQNLTILAKPDSGVFVERSSKNSAGKMSEKGSLVSAVHFANKRIAFLSTHLDAGSPVKRSADIRKQLCHLAEMNPKSANSTLANIRDRLKNKYSASFMFGDLNFRIAPPADGVSIDGRKAIWKGMTPQMMATIMCDTSPGGGREKLYECDQLNQSELVDPLQCGWTFPDFTNLCWPTYKRNYGKPEKVQAVQNFLANPSSVTFCKAYNMTAMSDLDKKHKKKQEGGLDDNSLVISKKRGEWDLGWLDRIGHIYNDNDAQAFALDEMVDVPSLVLSDHVCIVSKYSVDEATF